MGWPSESDFSDAVQNPSSVFSDPELRQGAPELNPLGLPRVCSGGFAVVFKFRCRSRNVAVKCFTRDLPERRQRYVAIGDYLRQARLPYTVGFDFLADGVRIRGRFYPVLKMEWVDGESLWKYVERHVSQPTALRLLAERWLTMSRTLGDLSVAHGDLQDANVIIVNGEIRLIDYDGMYVPSLNGQSSLELGAKHYQHPRRTCHDFGPYLDNFATWVIYVSLLALAAEPGLWDRFGGEPERLLLRRQDYEHFERSPVFRALEKSSDSEVRTTTKLLSTFAELRLQDIPRLDRRLDGARITGGSGNGSWLEDYLPKRLPGAIESPATTNLLSRSEASLPASFGLIRPGQGADLSDPFARSFAKERAYLLVSGGLAVAAIAACLIGAVASPYVIAIIVAALGFNGTVLATGYSSLEIVKRGGEFRKEATSEMASMRARQRELGTAALESEHAEARHKNLQAEFEKRRELAHRRETKEFGQLRAHLMPSTQKVAAKRAAVDKRHADEVAAVQSQLGRELSDLDRQLNELDLAEDRELKDAVKALRDRHIQSFLSCFEISAAEIPKITKSIKLRLVENGYKTAADLDPRVTTIAGIGPVRAAALKAWYDGLEGRAAATAPMGILSIQAAAIRAKYDGTRATLRIRRDDCRRRLDEAQHSIETRFKTLQEALVREEQQLDYEVSRREAEIQQRWQRYRLDLAASERQKHDEHARELDINRARIASLRDELVKTTERARKLESTIKALRKPSFIRYIGTVAGLRRSFY